MLFALLLGVTLIVLGIVVGPLLRAAKPRPARKAYDRAVYRDQLSELERDVVRGVVTPAEAVPARLELQRRLLAAEADIEPTRPGRREPALAAGLAVMIVLGAGGFYWLSGQPGLPDQPFAERGAERQEQAAAQAQMAQIRGMVAKLAEEMKSRPEDVEGWLRLGRSYAVLGQAEEAAAAFAKAEQLRPNDPAILLGEAQAMMAGHSLAEPIPDQVVALLKRVTALDPNNPGAMWYLGWRAAQDGDFATAREDWQRLLAALPENGDEHKTVAAALDAIKGR